MSDSDLNYYRNLNSPYTHYHNPWLDSPDRAGLPAVYDKDGWQVFPVHHGYDFVYNGCCITQRAGITSTPIEETIKQLQTERLQPSAFPYHQPNHPQGLRPR